jgi:hypothetical protein
VILGVLAAILGHMESRFDNSYVNPCTQYKRDMGDHVDDPGGLHAKLLEVGGSDEERQLGTKVTKHGRIVGFLVITSTSCLIAAGLVAMAAWPPWHYNCHFCVDEKEHQLNPGDSSPCPCKGTDHCDDGYCLHLFTPMWKGTVTMVLAGMMLVTRWNYVDFDGQFGPKFHFDWVTRWIKIRDKTGMPSTLPDSDQGEELQLDAGAVSPLEVRPVADDAKFPVSHLGVTVTGKLNLEKFGITWWQFVLHNHPVSAMFVFFQRDPYDFLGRIWSVALVLGVQFACQAWMSFLFCGTDVTFSECKGISRDYEACSYLLSIFVIPPCSKLIVWARKTSSRIGSTFFLPFGLGGIMSFSCPQVLCTIWCSACFEPKTHLKIATGMVLTWATILIFLALWVLVPDDIGDMVFFVSLASTAFLKQAVEMALSFFVKVRVPKFGVMFGASDSQLQDLCDESHWFCASSKVRAEQLRQKYFENDAKVVLNLHCKGLKISGHRRFFVWYLLSGLFFLGFIFAAVHSFAENDDDG